MYTQAELQPVLRGVQPSQRAGVAAAAVRTWARWSSTFGTAASLRFARTAHGLAAAGCEWAPAAADQLAAASGPGVAPLPQAPVMLVRDASGTAWLLDCERSSVSWKLCNSGTRLACLSMADFLQP